MNGAGNSSSQVQEVTLPDAAPENVPAPQISSVAANSLTVTALPPLTPNGVVTEYRLYRNGTRIDTLSNPDLQTSLFTFQVSGLLPFTRYDFYIEVCTVGGCGQSNAVSQVTAEAAPVGIDPPVGVALSSMSVNVTWRPPQRPNGVILR